MDAKVYFFFFVACLSLVNSYNPEEPEPFSLSNNPNLVWKKALPTTGALVRDGVRYTLDKGVPLIKDGAKAAHAFSRDYAWPAFKSAVGGSSQLTRDYIWPAIKKTSHYLKDTAYPTGKQVVITSKKFAKDKLVPLVASTLVDVRDEVIPQIANTAAGMVSKTCIAANYLQEATRVRGREAKKILQNYLQGSENQIAVSNEKVGAVIVNPHQIDKNPIFFMKKELIVVGQKGSTPVFVDIAQLTQATTVSNLEKIVVKRQDNGIWTSISGNDVFEPSQDNTDPNYGIRYSEYKNSNGKCYIVMNVLDGMTGTVAFPAQDFFSILTPLTMEKNNDDQDMLVQLQPIVMVVESPQPPMVAEVVEVLSEISKTRPKRIVPARKKKNSARKSPSTTGSTDQLEQTALIKAKKQQNITMTPFEKDMKIECKIRDKWSPGYIYLQYKAANDKHQIRRVADGKLLQAPASHIRPVLKEDAPPIIPNLAPTRERMRPRKKKGKTSVAPK